MEHSFLQRRHSGYRVEDDSVIISDSEEEVDNSRKNDQQIIDESVEIDDDADNSIEDTTPRKNKDSEDDSTPVVRLIRNINKKTRRYILNSDDSDYEQIDDHEDNEAYTINDFNNSDSAKSLHEDYDEKYYSDLNSDSDSSLSCSRIKNKSKKRKDVTHDNTREDIKELKLNSSNDSLNNMNLSDLDESYKRNNTDHKVADENKEIDVPVTIVLDSDSASGQNSDAEFAVSFAKEEIGVGNVDPLIAQKRALTVCKLEQLKNESAQMKVIYEISDDMGLGKTLTMIALILITLAKDSDESGDDDDGNDAIWTSKNRSSHHKGGTLVVCPASLLSQWENEVRNRCKRGLLSVEVHHGSNRQSAPKKLAKNDIVITTYNILSRDYKINSTLYKINWKRVILDEAHVVRNHKSQASEAVCGLVASRRWALTGTPIQNKELDLYSILKFLKCSPFDDLRVWKRWVDNKNAAGHQRLATVMKTIMLRRTKQELMSKGELKSLPDKSIEEVIVQLDQQEQLVYEKVLAYSRTLFAQFLTQRAEKEHMLDLYSGKYNKPSFLSNPNKETQFTKAQNKLLASHADVKTHEILVLLLRLRQICCHPALIHAMLDQEDLQQSGIMDIENVDFDLLSRMHNISLNGIDNEEENAGVDQRIMGNLLTAENPVFEEDRISSKMKMLLDLVKKILRKSDDKLIIVSQWTMLLEIIASHLPSIKGATFSKFTGSVPIKNRQGIVESFNSRHFGPRILLLSLTAGGVGLNLVGGNHLLLFDIHWNPQLETQAQDRIYRFGQTKNVYIYKFICVNTIEERIKALQERKLQIAKNVLSGDTSNAVGKLTLNDLKSLFGF
ncbi:Transcription termination factor 2 [Trachymyrmex zeteki]|uniref:Transcription termination factor 2 n=1 Tax=Mycetomoellerius zeteki TaxID=64791 RepID=A0A151WS71_9HYME|nr:PREDICTED: transcription termination factor 2-like [Trachymyrmex zeteki]KYQ50706.1 Transcription termination factor 2 [Trachymyrmex zeteki]